MKNFKKFNYTLKHKIVIFKLWKKYNTKVSLYRVIIHDLDKLLLVLLIGEKNSSKLHKKMARHHNRKTKEDFYESYLDWASARYTKKDKPLDAIDTARQYYPDFLDLSIQHYNDVKFK